MPRYRSLVTAVGRSCFGFVAVSAGEALSSRADPKRPAQADPFRRDRARTERRCSVGFARQVVERIPDKARRLFQSTPFAGCRDADAEFVGVTAAVQVGRETGAGGLGDGFQQAGQRLCFGRDELSQHLYGDRAVRSRIIDADRIRSVHDGTCWLDASTVAAVG